MRPLWAFSIEGGPRRVNHSAVIIDRRIFMFGGFCSNEDYPSTSFGIDIYAFDTVSIRWRKIQCSPEQKLHDIPYMRYGHSSVAIGQKAYLFGGRNNQFGPCNKLFYFDTEKSSWYTPKVKGQIPGARDGHGMCVASGNIYVFGGFESETDGFSEEIFMLDMKAMTWTLLVTKGQSGLWRDFHTLTACGDKIYLFGGRADESVTFVPQTSIYDNDIKVLDLNNLVWTSVGQPTQKLPVGRRSHTTFFHKDCLYIFGGYNSEIRQHFNDLWKFDPESGLWSEILSSGEKPCQRRRHCCCYVDNKAYIFGGTSPLPGQKYGQDLKDLSDIHVLDLEPSLRTLCLHVILKNRRHIDISCLPISLRKSIKSMTTDSDITSIRKEYQG